jgi:uncharacterized phage-associated protein
MPRPYRPLALANYLIRWHGYEDGIDHMKLQKLVYLAHGWWLAYHDDLVVTERPQVWRYGPVFPSMYRALSGSGERPIRFPQRETPFGSPPDIDDDDHDVTGLMDWVWSRYGGYTAIRLSDMTHQPGTPWRVMAERHRFQAPPNLEIPDDITKQYFLEVEARKQGIDEPQR